MVPGTRPALIPPTISLKKTPTRAKTCVSLCRSLFGLRKTCQFLKLGGTIRFSVAYDTVFYLFHFSKNRLDALIACSDATVSIFS